MTMTKANRQSARAAAVLTLALTLPLAGCASASSSAAPAPDRPSTAKPVEIMNCGHILKLEAPPERVVTIKSTPLELMLALGLSDRVVGSAFLDGPVPDDLAPEGWEPNVISSELPSKELLLAANPDLVFAGWESNLSADGIGTRGDLEQLGIQGYVAPPACEFGDAAAAALTFDDVFDLFEEVGTIFDVGVRARNLVAEQRARLEAITPLATAPTALWYSSGSDTPFVGGGTGTPNMIMDAANLTNAAADEPQSWFGMPWERFVATDPDVIVLVDAPWNTAEEKIARLEEHPAAREMRAVRNQTYITVDFAETEAGVRNIDAVEKIAEAAESIALAP